MMKEYYEWPNFLRTLENSKSTHYLWLRLLSYLEYIGYRKMVKSLGYAQVEKQIYQHLSDEIRHSLMLKEIADRVFANSFAFEQSKENFIQIAENYFQSIDKMVDDWVLEILGQHQPHLCYALVSYLIERRAMQVYPQYYAFSQEAELKNILQKIIRDESEHLDYLKAFLAEKGYLKTFDDSEVWQFEEAKFTELLKAFCLCVQSLHHPNIKENFVA